MDALLYCNKQKPYLEYSPQNACPNNYMCFDEYGDGDSEFGPLNGYAIAECEVDIDEIRYDVGHVSAFEKCFFSAKEWPMGYVTEYLSDVELLQKSCLSEDEMYAYMATKANEKKKYYTDTFGYAIQIKKLKVLDKPIVVNKSTNIKIIYCTPKELCRILNKKQTIVVRHRR